MQSHSVKISHIYGSPNGGLCKRMGTELSTVRGEYEKLIGIAIWTMEELGQTLVASSGINA